MASPEFTDFVGINTELCNEVDTLPFEDIESMDYDSDLVTRLLVESTEWSLGLMGISSSDTPPCPLRPYLYHGIEHGIVDFHFLKHRHDMKYVHKTIKKIKI